jgi:hypothetical protein
MPNLREIAKNVAQQVTHIVDVTDFNKVAHKSGSTEVAEVHDFDKLAHMFAEQVTAVAERIAEASTRKKGRSGARWLIPLAAGAGVAAAARNRSRIAAAVRHATGRAADVAPTDALGRLAELTRFGDENGDRDGKRRSADTGDLREHLRDRAERRQRRREAMASR